MTPLAKQFRRDQFDLKICHRCNQEKPLMEFYKHPNMADGHLSKCIPCHNADNKKRYDSNRQNLAWVIAERERSRNKCAKQRAMGQKRKPSPALTKKYRQRHKIKIRARRIAGRAVKTGLLQPPPLVCQDCGTPTWKLHKHHPDYAKPILIEWLCTACHGIRHRKELA